MTQVSNYKIQEYINRKKGAYNRKTIRVAKKNNECLSTEEVREFFDLLLTQDDTETNNINITVKTIDGRSLTLKKFEDDTFEDWDGEEYTKNKVQDDTKFKEFLFVDFILK